MNAKLESLFEQIKELALHEASELLAVLAGHVSEGVSTNLTQSCPKGQSWSDSLKKCVDDPA